MRVHGLVVVDVLRLVRGVMGRVRLVRPSTPSRTSGAGTLRAKSSSDTRRRPGAWSEIHGSLHGLPSRQMRTVVHHAGLGIGNCGSCSQL